MNSQQIAQFPHRLRTAFRLYVSKFNGIGSKIKNYEMPERIKGTFFERWTKYWQGLYVDYKDVVIDTAKDCKERPLRAAIYATILGSCFYCNRHNPDETMFREQLIRNNLKLILVGEPIRNPVSVRHMKWLEQCYNEGIVRRLNLGIISMIWLDNYDRNCSLYKAVCPYLKPRYVTFYKRIVDIGFLDKWWILEKKMEDYDVNDSEFNVIEVENNTASPVSTV